jgi:hypothetical protein
MGHRSRVAQSMAVCSLLGLVECVFVPIESSSILLDASRIQQASAVENLNIPDVSGFATKICS